MMFYTKIARNDAAGPIFLPLKSAVYLVDWAFGSVALLVGIALAYGGMTLMAVGGTSYYLWAGASVVALAVVVVTGRIIVASWIIAFLTTGTLAWAIAEVGFDGWALLPRLDWLIAISAIWLLGRGFWPKGRRPLTTRALIAVALPSALSLLILIGSFLFPSHERYAEAANTRWQNVSPFNDTSRAPRSDNVAASNDAAEWTAYAGSNLSNHYSPAAEITAANVKKLELAWEFHTGDLPIPGARTMYMNENTPLKVGNLLYVCTPTKIVIALDAISGHELWRFDPKADRTALRLAGATCRGVAYFRSPIPSSSCRNRILWGIDGGRLAAVDAQTGHLCPGFGNSGFVDLKIGMGDFAPGYWTNTSPPIVIGGNVVIGHMVRDGQDRRAPSGVVRAYDAMTGAFKWAWDIGHTGSNLPNPPDKGFTTGTPNVWSPMAADEKLGLIYMGTGNASGDFWGGNRSPQEEKFTDAITAIEAKSGHVRWSFRTVNHDLWDYDIGPQANLVDWPSKSGTRPALIQATKSGQIFVLDRETGTPLSKVVQKDAPRAEGINHTARTQPWSVDMPNTIGIPGDVDERLKESDAWGISPFDQLACRIQFKKMRYEGPFTPPQLGKRSLVFPGGHGGVNWGGVSVDLKRGVMIVNSNRMPYIESLVTREQVNQAGSRSINEGGPTKRYLPQVGFPVGAFRAPWLSFLRLPCIAPPWGFLTGVDLRSKKVLWTRPLGTIYDNGLKKYRSRLKLQVGTPSDSGSLTTAGGVTFIGAATDRFMRAFDTSTGRLLWDARLPAGAHGTPLSYTANGHQYVVAVVGGHARLHTKIGDSVIAWRLPRATLGPDQTTSQ